LPQRQGPGLKEKTSPPFHGAACGVQVKHLTEKGRSQEPVVKRDVGRMDVEKMKWTEVLLKMNRGLSYVLEKR